MADRRQPRTRGQQRRGVALTMAPTTHVLDMTREEWAADAERYTRQAHDPIALIPAGHPVYAWSKEAQDLGRDLAAKVRALLTAQLRENEGRRADDIRSRRLALGRHAKAGEWDEVAASIRRAMNHELVGVDTSTLTYDLCSLERLVRERTAAIHRLGQDMMKQAVGREIARRTTDEAWEQELERRGKINAFLAGSWRPTR